MPEIKKILYTTDFSDTSASALEYAVHLARQCGAGMHCIHVVDEAYQHWVGFDLAAMPPPPPPEDLTAAAETHMSDFLEGRLPADVSVVRKVLHGRPFVEIVRYARDQQMDLIVMGTHGRTGLSHILMGSVAEKVVRRSPCPVLTVRHPEQEFEMP